MSAIIYGDRVGETSTTTGVGTYSLAGAIAGFQAFDAIGDGNLTHYLARMGNEWEVGLGTVTVGTPNQVARSRILSSSNSNNAVNWSAGTKSIYVTIPSARYLGAAETENVDNFTEFLGAVEYLTQKYRQHINEGINCVVNLSTGFEWTGQFVANGGDLGFITVTSDDAEVPLIRSGLTTGANGFSFSANSNMNSLRPAILGYNGAQLFRLACLLDMDTSGSATANYAGILLHGRAGVIVLEGAGVKNVVKPSSGYSGRAINISHGSFATGWGSIWSGSHIGMRISNTSGGSFRECVASGCEYGLDTNGSSMAGIQDADLTGCVYHSIWAQGGARVKAEGVDCSNTGTGGTTADYAAMLIDGGAQVEAYNAIVSGSGRGAQVQGDGRLQFSGGLCVGTIGPGMTVRDGGRIIMSGGAEVSGTLNGAAINAQLGGWIDITGSNIINSPSATGVLADGGVVIAGPLTVVTGNKLTDPNRDLVVLNGGEIHAYGIRTTNGGSPGVVALADTNVPRLNERSALGIIRTNDDPVVEYTGTYTPGSPAPIAAGGVDTMTISAAAVDLGDMVEAVAYSGDLQGVITHGSVDSTGNVTVVFHNVTASPVTLASAAVRVRVRKA